MAKLYLTDPNNCDSKIGSVLEKFTSKVESYPPGTCPISVQYSMLLSSMNQTCGKCVPCRDGLRQISFMMKSVLDGDATMETLERMKHLATLVCETADCAIGYQSAREVIDGIEAFKQEYESHILNHVCPNDRGQKVSCINMCPAHVDVPAYIALVGEGDYAGAIKMIRRDNPLPTACAMICEHPCEKRCRRMLIDDAVNIRGLKKYAVDQIAADKVEVPKPQIPSGKRISVIGGGPAGLTCAYFLAQMGHKVTIHEGKEKLGGMLRYGIPNYRFPKERLDEDIRAILSAGDIRVKCGEQIETAEQIQAIRETCDAMFIAIGAQVGKKLRLDGIDAGNVESAVDMLDKIGHGNIPDYTDKTVVVIGGGNVAMDAARSALRCNAKDVRMVYRRRQDDMTALKTEIESAIMEGIEIMSLQAPVMIEKDSYGNCCALIVQPQMIGPYDKAGRPSPMDAKKDALRVPCDIILIAVGQDIVSKPFEDFGIPANRGVFKAGLDTEIEGMPGIFVGGDCATAPATAIRAIAAGKVAARNIDEYLGYHHKLNIDVEVPVPKENNRTATGRANITERPAYIRKHDFEGVENPYTYEEAMQECSRCLRCDHFGCGVLQGGCDL